MIGCRLWEVFANKRWSHMEVRLNLWISSSPWQSNHQIIIVAVVILIESFRRYSQYLVVLTYLTLHEINVIIINYYYYYYYYYYLEIQETIRKAGELPFIACNSSSSVVIYNCGIHIPRGGDWEKANRQPLSATCTENSWRCYQVATKEENKRNFSKFKVFSFAACQLYLITGN